MHLFLPKAALLKANEEPHMTHGNDESKFHTVFTGERADVPLSLSHRRLHVCSLDWVIPFHKHNRGSGVHLVLVIVLSKTICSSGQDTVIIKLLHVTQVWMSYIL